MEKGIRKIIKILLGNKKVLWLLSLLILIIPSYFRLIRPGFFFMQDDLQAFRIQQLDKCFQEIQIPCRWVPDAGYQYGYPQFIYYPPFVYYVGEIFHLVGFQFIDSVKILFILGYILSALFMFLLMSEIFGNLAGFTSAAFYTYVPYKAVEVYVRGAMSEFWALVFFPLLFWASYKMIKNKKVLYNLLFSIFFALLLTTHTLTAMIFTPFLGVWIMFWIIGKKELYLIRNFIIYGLLGAGLAGFYILPLLFERKYVHVESMLGGYFDYRQHFVSLYKLFLSREWGYGSSGFPNEVLNLSTGLIQWIAALFGIAIALVKFKKNKAVSLLVLVLSACELLVLFMIHMKSSFIWSLIPALSWLQFPWRFLSLSIFLLAIIVGILISLLGKFANYVSMLIILVAVMLNISYFVPRSWYKITDQEKFSGDSWRKQQTISIFDYLPIYAQLPPPSRAPDLPEILYGKADILNYRKGSNWQEGEIVVSEEVLLRLPLFDFPGMEVKIDGNKVTHINSDCRNQPYCLGLITVNVPPGRHQIGVKLTSTTVRWVGDVTTIASLVFVILISFKSRTLKDR